MKIDELTIGEAREIARMFGGCTTGAKLHPYEIGKGYFIRSVTHHYTGRLMEVYEHELVLEDAAWIADDGRFSQSVAGGDFGEVEPYPDGRRVVIGRGAILDASIRDAIPRVQK